MTNFGQAARRQHSPEEMLSSLRHEMTIIKSEETSLKKQIISLNEQFQDLMISVAELYPDILNEEFARRPGQPDARHPAPPRKSPDRISPKRTLSYRYSPESLRDGKGSLLAEWRENRKIRGREQMCRKQFSGEPARNDVPSTEDGSGDKQTHALSYSGTRNNSRQSHARVDDASFSIREEAVHVEAPENRGLEETSLEKRRTVDSPRREIDGASVIVDSPAAGASSSDSNRGVSDFAAVDSERRKRIKQRLKESRKLDVIHLGLF